MGTVILISIVAIVVAVVGCFFIWRLDASRAEEVEHTPPPPESSAAPELDEGRRSTPPRSIDS
jgi:hypothetical protein